MNGKRLVYFDNAATSQKPQVVIERLVAYYSGENANVHRGVYHLSEVASEAYEGARDYIATWLNAPSRSEVIFVRGATEGINLVASSWGGHNLMVGDEVLITGMEHHANLVPWQRICAMTGAKLLHAQILEDGTVDLESFSKLLSPRTKFVSLVWVSNSLGTINPIKEVIALTKAQGDIPILVDACQAAPHLPIDVQELGADFLVFSGHKTFGPTGIGVLWGRESLLDNMTPYQSGGDMIKTVSLTEATYNDLPYKFEAGTPHISGAIGLHTALEFMRSFDSQEVIAYENQLLGQLTSTLESISGVKIIGTNPHKIPVCSFVVEGAHPLDIGTLLDFEGIAIRTGNHCTQPLLDRFGVSATSRASLAFYNTEDEIEFFGNSMVKVLGKLR